MSLSDTLSGTYAELTEVLEAIKNGSIPYTKETLDELQRIMKDIDALRKKLDTPDSEEWIKIGE